MSEPAAENSAQEAEIDIHKKY